MRTIRILKERMEEHSRLWGKAYHVWTSEGTWLFRDGWTEGPCNWTGRRGYNGRASWRAGMGWVLRASCAVLRSLDHEGWVCWLCGCCHLPAYLAHCTQFSVPGRNPHSDCTPCGQGPCWSCLIHYCIPVTNRAPGT